MLIRMHALPQAREALTQMKPNALDDGARLALQARLTQREQSREIAFAEALTQLPTLKKPTELSFWLLESSLNMARLKVANKQIMLLKGVSLTRHQRRQLKWLETQYLLFSNNIPQAYAHLQRSLRQEPDQAQLQKALLEIELKLGLLDKAKATFKRYRNSFSEADRRKFRQRLLP